MLLVTVDSRIRIPTADLPAPTLVALKVAHEHTNPEFGLKRALGLPTYNIHHVIRTWKVNGGEISLPRGGMERVRETFRDHKQAFKVVDKRHEGQFCKRFPKYIGHKMRYYQEAAIAAALEREQCILRAPTGSGKTSLAFALLARIKLNALVILPTGGLYKQWQQRAEVELGISGDQLGMIQGKKKRLRPVTIAMQQTLARGVPEDVLDYFGAVIIDEAQLASARTYVEVVDQFPARYRIAVSADERRKDRKEFLAYDLFSDVAYEVKRHTLEKQGHVLDVEIRVIPTNFEADWYGLPEDGEEKEVDFNRLLNEMVMDRGRDQLALNIVKQEIDNGEQVIMLTARRDHARILQLPFIEHDIPAGFFLGKQEGGDEIEFERTRVGMNEGTIKVGIGTYGALGFGIDLPAVSVGIAMTPLAGNDQKFNQVRGRLCRPNKSTNKTQGRLYVLWDKAVYPGHLKKMIAKNENVVVWSNEKWVDARQYLGVRKRSA